MPEKRLRLHERLSENYLSVNFSTLLLTLLINGAITVACSGGRAKGEPPGSPESPSEWTLHYLSRIRSVIRLLRKK